MYLYDFDMEIARVFSEAVDRETGEVDDELLAKLDELEMARDHKIEQIACYIKTLKANAAAVKVEKDMLAKRQKAYENKAEGLSRYLSRYLNGQKFTSARCEVSFRKSTRVEMDPGVNILSIPSDYLRFKDPELDKTKAAAALKAGETIEGLHLEESQSMTIK